MPTKRIRASGTVEVVWKEKCELPDAAGCGDIHFHDLRHEATCRFYETTKLTDIDVSLITGHKDLRVLRRYANLRGSHPAQRIG